VRSVSKLLLLAGTLMLFAGCATNYYNIPRESYEKKVRVLGVAPILLDTESDIRHPEKSEVLKIVREANRKNERELVDILKSNGDYAAVRFLEEDAEQLATSLLPRRERRDDAGVVYNKYFYKQEELKRLIAKYNLDAVMLINVSGITMMETIYSNTLTYLEDNYNSLIMTAQILDGDGTLLWEYPNFRQKFLSYTKLFDLQYPDFEEARANLTDQVRIKNKSIPGIGRAFARSESSSVKSSKQVASLYNSQFADMNSLLKPFRTPLDYFKDEKKKPEAALTPVQDEYAPRPSSAPVATVPPPSLPLPPPPAATAAVVKPAAPSSSLASGQTAAVSAPAVRPVKREFEPVAPLESGTVETQIIREPEIK